MEQQEDKIEEAKLTPEQVREIKVASIMQGEQEMSELIMDLQYVRGMQHVHREQVKTLTIPAAVRMRSSNHLMTLNTKLAEYEARIAYLQQQKDAFMVEEGLAKEPKPPAAP